MVFSVKSLRNYYKGRARVRPEILRRLRQGKEVVYGAQALNAQLPRYLRRYSRDYDLLTKKPRKIAEEYDNILEAAVPGRANFFEVKPAQHKGTYRVFSRVEGVSVVDVTRPEETVSFRRIRGVKYVPLKFIEDRARKVLRDPESEFRHGKEQDSLNRIAVYKELRGLR